MLPLLLVIESPPLLGIVPALDVVKDICSRLGSRLVLLPIDPLPFEPAKETLGRGIVGATAHCTHATSHLMGGQKLRVLVGGKLSALFGMENDRGSSRPLPDGHEDRLDDQLPILPRTH